MSTINIPYLFTATSRAQTPSAPVFDPSKREKYWADPNPTADANGNATYSIVDDAGTGFSPLVLSKAEAEALNIPGHPDFSPAPPQLTATLNGSTIIPVVSRAAAEAFAISVGVQPSTLVDTLASIQSFQIAYPTSDPTARAWELTMNGVQVQVAYMLSQQNANGVGAPGHWNGVVWVSDLPSPDASSPVMGLPVDMSKVPAGSTVLPANIETGVPEIEIPDAPAAAATGGNGADPNTPAILVGINKLLAFFRIS